MTAEQRIKEMKDWLNDPGFGDDFISKENALWLIQRVEKLTEALEEIIEKDTCDCDMETLPNECPHSEQFEYIARRALEHGP